MYFTVTYTANYEDDHMSDASSHTSIYEKTFSNMSEAQTFYKECTSPQKDIKVVIDDFKDNENWNTTFLERDMDFEEPDWEWMNDVARGR